MRGPSLHRFEVAGRRFALDPDSCFCFECDEISWEILEHYPQESFNRIMHLLGDKHDREEIAEVIGEIEWLRSAKSILKAPKQEDLEKQYEVEPGLKRLTVSLPAASAGTAGWLRRAPGVALSAAVESLLQDSLTLLLGRSGSRQKLYLELRRGAEEPPLEGLGEWTAGALRRARLAGKQLTVALRRGAVALPQDPALQGHQVDAILEVSDPVTAESEVEAFQLARLDSLARLVKALEKPAAATGKLVIRPGHAALVEGVKRCDEAGIRNMVLDIDSAYLANPQLSPSEMLQGLTEVATYYANRLLQHHYFRLDPFAELFWRIYNGSPLRRADGIGVNELAVSSVGRIYPSALLLESEAHCVGDLRAGTVDEDALKPLQDVGAPTTAPCIACWARHYCGGGTAAVHHALTGSLRTPAEAWCNAQRAYIESSVGAFNLLSAAGVNFTRVYQSLDRRSKASFLTLAKAAFTMSIGIRPIDEADAELLTRWENWNEAAYFACGEGSMFLATRYDREMDSLHPRGDEQELILIRKDGSPFGLLKLRPDKLPGTARAAVYFRQEADYGDAGIRRSFRMVLHQAAGQGSFRHLILSAGPQEQALAAFLEAVGFEQAGVEREALYLHGAYHDVHIYALRLEN